MAGRGGHGIRTRELHGDRGAASFFAHDRYLSAVRLDEAVSISSAGLVAADARPPFFVLVERALRDEGTSCHYLPAARYADADPALTDTVARALAGTPTPLLRGASWTTDAPFRESASPIAGRRAEGVLSVEMEAAALLAMGRALRRPVTCLARVTNAMATRPGDFEKGGHDGQEEALEVCARALAAAVAYVRSTRAGKA
jgi:uridine phosphorylase